MFPIFMAFLMEMVEILKVAIPLFLVFGLAGDLLWK